MPKKRFSPFKGFEEVASAPEKDYVNAKVFGSLLLGAQFLFITRAFRIEYVPLNGVLWCYKRIEQGLSGAG